MSDPFTVTVPTSDKQGTAFTVRATVRVGSTNEVAAASAYLRSLDFKNAFQRWLDGKFPNFGFALGSHAYPVFEKDGDRSSPVIGYETEIRLTRPL